MINKILLAVDGSQNAERAIHVAADLASGLNADLMIVHVLMHGRPPEELVRMAEVEHLVKEAQSVVAPDATYVKGDHVAMLGGTMEDPRTPRIIAALGDQLVARAKSRCIEGGAKSVDTIVRRGDYAEEILNAANDFDADMIVIGSRGLGALKSAVLGSVSQKVLHHAPCSVVTVR